jgi:hypothetical protein
MTTATYIAHQMQPRFIRIRLAPIQALTFKGYIKVPFVIDRGDGTQCTHKSPAMQKDFT